MPNPVIPKLNSDPLQTAAPNALALSSGEIATNVDLGYIFLKKRNNQVVDLSPIKGIQVGNTLTTAGIAAISSSDISGLSPVATIDTASGLALSSQQLSTLYNTSISDSVESVAVGGASALPASTWKDKTLVEVLDTILFPDLNPTYIVPTISLSNTVSGVKEVGSLVTQQISVVGTENDAGAFTKITILKGGSALATADSAALTTGSASALSSQYGYANPNNPNLTYTFINTESGLAVEKGATTWSSTGDYSAGVAKKNNKGVDDARSAAVRSTNAPQAASTGFASTSATVTGIYPYFWGTSSTQLTAAEVATAIAAGTENKGEQSGTLLASNGTVTVTFAATNKYVWVAIPNDTVNGYNATTSKTKWYNTALNNGDIGTGEFILAPVTVNVNSPDSYWSGISYKIYISGYATTTSGTIQFQN